MDNSSPLFDRALLNPRAADSIDRSGQQLLTRAVGLPPNEPPPEPFPSRHQPVLNLTDREIISEPMMAWTDWAGRTVGRYYFLGGQEVSLKEQGYSELRRLVEKIIDTKPFSSNLSAEFVEEETFIWWRSSLRGETSSTLSSHLLKSAESAVAERDILIPITAIEIETPFYLGNVIVKPISPALFDNFGALKKARKPELSDIVKQQSENLKKQYGNLTGVLIKVTGDKKYATDVALKIAFDVSALFRFMSPAAVSWNVAFPCIPKGCEHIRKTTLIELKDETISVLNTGIIDHGMFSWRLSLNELHHQMSNGLNKCIIFFSEERLTNYQTRLRTSLFAFSDGIATFDVNKRLVYAMSAAEHLLLRDGNEQIQSAVGERMAFLIALDPEKRGAIVRNFKKAYGLRSRQVHNLASVDDEEVLGTFFINMYTTLLRAIHLMDRYKDRNEFLDEIDAVKFGKS